MERMRTWTSIHSSQRYIYIYLCMYIIVTCLAFTSRNFEKRIFERRKSAIGSKNNRNLPRVNKCDIILYIYIYMYICLSVCLYSLEKLAFPKVHPSQWSVLYAHLCAIAVAPLLPVRSVLVPPVRQPETPDIIRQDREKRYDWRKRKKEILKKAKKK